MTIQKWTTWSLFNLDTFETIEGQFPIESPTQNLLTQYEDAWTLNRSNPITQWMHGQNETWSFQATIRAKDSEDDIQRLVNSLQEAIKKQSAVNRPPIWVFSWGFFQVQCVVENLGGVVYDFQPNGKLRQAKFSITLRKYTEFDIVVTDPNAPFRDTLYYIAKVGQTYEFIANIRYQQPIWGDLLRRRNPDLPYPVSGKIIALPESSTLLEEEVEPDSPQLQRTEEGLRIRRNLFALRSKSKISHIL